jgi:hypothetical protein
VYAIYRKVPISLRGGPVHLDVSLDKQIKEIKTELTAIGVAVNNVPKGAPPLVERVQSVEALAHWSASAIHALAKHVGLNLSEPPDRRTSIEE